MTVQIITVNLNVNEVQLMTLIKCFECGKEFSDKANSCPNCACPTKEVLNEINKKKLENKRKIEKKNEKLLNMYSKEITIIDLLINIYYETYPNSICACEFSDGEYEEFYIDEFDDLEKANDINKEHEISIYTNCYGDESFLIENFALNNIIRVSEDYENLHNITNVKLSNSINSGDLINLLDLYILAVKGFLPKQITFINNDELCNRIYNIKRNYDCNSNDLNEIIENDRFSYFDCSNLSLEQKIRIIS